MRTLTTLRPYRTLDLRKRRMWFDDPPPADPPAPPPAPAKPTQTPPADKTFTQAEMDAIIGNRVKEAVLSATTKVYEGLGVKDAKELETVVTDYRKGKEAQMTEVERANTAAKEAADKLAETEQKLADSEKARLIDRRNTRIAALAPKAHSASDVILWAESDGKDLLEKVVKEDGSLDEAAIKKLVEACQKAKPYLFGAGGPGSPSNAGGRVPQPEVNVPLKKLSF